MRKILAAGAVGLGLILGGLLLAATVGATPADKCLKFNKAQATATINPVGSEQTADGLWITVEAGC